MFVEQLFKKVRGALVLCGVCFWGCGSPGGLHADRVLVNGNIITVDPGDSVVEALAIRDGRIVAVGGNAEIEALVGPETERIDLEGKTATPGLLDMHCHFASGGLAALYTLDLSYPNIVSVEGATEKVEEQVEELGGGEWVVGGGWDEGKLLERRYIYARDIDPVSPENPVFLSHTMGHYAVANSVALQMANITKDTPDPFGGTIDRDADGNPTGVLKETAQSLVSSLIPDVTFEQRKEGIAHIAREFNKEGMTGLKDPGIGVEMEGLPGSARGRRASRTGVCPMAFGARYRVGAGAHRSGRAVHQALHHDG